FVTGGTATAPRNHKFISYTTTGDPLDTTADLAGTLPLDRALPDTKPPERSDDSGNTVRIAILHEERDEYGSVKFQSGPNGRCRFIGRQEPYAELATRDTIRVGTLTLVPPGETCGPTPLVTNATYDRGLSAVTDVTDLHGE